MAIPTPMVRVRRNLDSSEGWAQQTSVMTASTIIEFKALSERGGDWAIILDSDGVWTDVSNADFQTYWTIIVWDPNA